MMNSIRRLPGLGAGSRPKLIAAGALYAALGLCVLAALIGAVVSALGTGVDPEEVAVTDAPGEPANRPAIDQAAIEEAITFIEGETIVSAAEIAVNDETVTMSLTVNRAATADASRDVLDSFVRTLASRVAAEHDDLESPKADDLGELWEHYALQVSAGPAADDPYAEGKLSQGERQFSWH